MKKRLLAFLLVLVMVAGVIPFTALADGASIVAQGTCGAQGDNVTWVLTDDGVLTISGTGAMADYSSASAAPWSSNASQIKSAVMGSGVTNIGNYALAIASMENITFSDTVAKIGSYALSGSGLKTLTIPGTVTEIGANAVRNCKSLTVAEVPASVTQMGESVFRKCSALKTVKIHSAHLSDSMFANCSALTDVQLDNTLTTIGQYAFSMCSTLKSITIPDSVTSIGEDAFYYNTALETVKLPAGLTEIPIQLFAYDAALKTVSVDFSKITKVGNAAFTGCASFDANVNFSDALTTLEHSAFKNTGIKSVIIPSAIKTIDREVFSGCGALTTVTFNEGLETIEQSAFQDCISLTELVFPSTLTTINRNYAFKNCADLKEIVFSKNLTLIGNYSFEGCSALETVTLYDKLATVADNAFSGCNNLATVNFHGTEEQWAAIDFTTGNDPLTAATVVYRTFADEKPVVKAENDKASGKVKLTITPVEGAVKYKIYVAEKAEGPFTLVKETTELTYTHNGKAGTKYFFKVVAVNADGKESAESAVVNKVQLPGQVKSLKAKSTKKKEVTLTWKKVTGAKKYFIYMSKNGKTGWKKIGTATKTKFVYKKGTPGKKLYFRVQAVTANGKKGEFSKVVSVKVKK